MDKIGRRLRMCSPKIQPCREIPIWIRRSEFVLDLYDLYDINYTSIDNGESLYNLIPYDKKYLLIDEPRHITCKNFYIVCEAIRYFDIRSEKLEYKLYVYLIKHPNVVNEFIEIYPEFLNIIKNIKDVSTECDDAAFNGSLLKLKYLHNNKKSWDEDTCSFACDAGNLDCLKYVILNGCPKDINLCTQSMEYGHLDCLEFAYLHGCDWNEKTNEKAAKYGHIDCLKYAFENSCEWDEKTCNAAAKFNKVECLKYCIEHHCPYDKSNLYSISQLNKSIDCLKYLDTLKD